MKEQLEQLVEAFYLSRNTTYETDQEFDVAFNEREAIRDSIHELLLSMQSDDNETRLHDFLIKLKDDSYLLVRNSVKSALSALGTTKAVFTRLSLPGEFIKFCENGDASELDIAHEWLSQSDKSMEHKIVFHKLQLRCGEAIDVQLLDEVLIFICDDQPQRFENKQLVELICSLAIEQNFFGLWRWLVEEGFVLWGYPHTFESIEYPITVSSAERLANNANIRFHELKQLSSIFCGLLDLEWAEDRRSALRQNWDLLTLSDPKLVQQFLTRNTKSKKFVPQSPTDFEAYVKREARFSTRYELVRSGVVPCHRSH